MTDIEKVLDVLALMQTRMATKEDIAKINIKIETDIEPKLEALAEGQSAILEQLVPCSRVDELENEIKFLKNALFRMSEDVERLKKAQ